MPDNRLGGVPRWYRVVDDANKVLKARHIYGLCPEPFDSLCREVDDALPAVFSKGTNVQEALDGIINRAIDRRGFISRG
jgi:hypothetical protein